MINPSVRIVKTKNGIDTFIQRTRAMDKKEVVSGLPSGSRVEAGSRHGSGHTDYRNMAQLRRVMVWQETGTKRIPSRPWFSNVTVRQRELIEKKVALEYSYYQSKKQTLKVTLDNIGKYMVNKFRDSIRNMPGPPLKKSTIRRKGHALLLRDTYSAFNSLTYRISNVNK